MWLKQSWSKWIIFMNTLTIQWLMRTNDLPTASCPVKLQNKNIDFFSDNTQNDFKWLHSSGGDLLNKIRLSFRVCSFSIYFSRTQTLLSRPVARSYFKVRRGCEET